MYRWRKKVNNAYSDFCEKALAAKIASEYDQETPQSQTADNPTAPRVRANHHETPVRQTKQSNKPPPHFLNTRMDTK